MNLGGWVVRGSPPGPTPPRRGKLPSRAPTCCATRPSKAPKSALGGGGPTTPPADEGSGGAGRSSGRVDSSLWRVSAGGTAARSLSQNWPQLGKVA